MNFQSRATLETPERRRGRNSNTLSDSRIPRFLISGGSINGHAQNNSLKTYEFAVPQLLVGKLIGKRGISLQQINHKASVRIVIRDHPVLRDDKLCLIEGYPAGITAALKLIRQKFPENKFPHFTLEQISWPESEEMLSTMPCKLDSLSLVNNVSNDISVCHIVTPNHLFLRLPLHPTYPALISLDRDMTELYNTTEAPLVSDDLESKFSFFFLHRVLFIALVFVCATF